MFDDVYATFNNISAISWRHVLLVEETGEHGEKHRSVVSHWLKSLKFWYTTWMKLFQERVVRTKFDIYVFIRSNILICFFFVLYIVFLSFLFVCLFICLFICFYFCFFLCVQYSVERIPRICIFLVVNTLFSVIFIRYIPFITITGSIPLLVNY